MLKVSPTTKRLNIFQKMAVSQKAKRSIVPYVQKNIENIDNPSLKEGLKCAFNFFNKKIGKTNQLRIIKIDDIIQKYNQCKDEEVKEEIIDCAEWFCESKNKDKPKILNLMNSMLDAINVSNEQYSNLYASNSFPKNICKRFALKKENLDSEPRKLNKKLALLSTKANIDSPVYKNFAKYSALKDFILSYSHNQAELVDFIYERAYLSKQDKSVKKYTSRVQENTGIKILDYTTEIISEKKLYKTEKELEMFNNLMSEGEPIITFLEINPVDFMFITEQAEGYQRKIGNKNHITLPEWVKQTELRHELTHAVDKGILVPLEVDPFTFIHIANDLREVNAPESAISYAYQNTSEAKAVLGEYYSDKFSQATKDFIVKEGLPPQILKLKSIDFYDLLIKHRSFNDKELETIEKIRTRFDGIIPEKIYDCIVKEPMFEIKKVVELTKGKDNIKPEDFVEIFQALTKLERLKSDKNHLANGIRFKREIPRGVTCLDNIIDSPRQMRTLIHKYEIEIELAEIELGKLLDK